MVKEVVHDPVLLAIKSAAATRDDLQVARDLLDTLAANKDECVGMAANMIGVHKRIIVFDNEGSLRGACGNWPGRDPGERLAMQNPGPQ